MWVTKGSHDEGSNYMEFVDALIQRCQIVSLSDVPGAVSVAVLIGASESAHCTAKSLPKDENDAVG